MSRINAPLGFIEPQLLTSLDQPPRGDEWIDGSSTTDSALSRSSLNWTDRYPEIISMIAKPDCRAAIIDGEVIVQEALKVAIR